MISSLFNLDHVQRRIAMNTAKKSGCSVYSLATKNVLTTQLQILISYFSFVTFHIGITGDDTYTCHWTRIYSIYLDMKYFFRYVVVL